MSISGSALHGPCFTPVQEQLRRRADGSEMQMIGPILTSLDALPPSAALWRAAEPAAVAALHCPFCSGLAAGTLPRTAFGAYIAQDHFFLAAFGDAYAQAAKLLPPAVREKHGPAVAALVAGIESERAGHAASAAQWGVTDISSVEPLAATREYCALLAAAAEQGSLGVLFAAAAPCMRLYAWLGVQLKAVARDGTPYHEWCARDTSLRGLEAPAGRT